MNNRTDVNLRADVPVQALPTFPKDARWSVPALILFRFAFVYLALYSLLTISMSAQRTFHERLLFPALDRFWATLSVWTATQLRISDFNPRYLGSDSVVSYARVALFIFIATAVTVAWSLADRRRTQYSTLYEWLRLVVRIGLGLTIVRYGVQKVLAVQMAPISPHQLIAPLGYFTPQQLLWAFMGASPGYQIITGLVEVLAGALLFLPRFTTLGALLSVVAMTNVFLLNVFYDVDVKLFSLHLLGMACFLLLPDIRRLADVLIFNRASVPVGRPRLFQWKRYARVTSALPIVLAIAVIGWTVSTEQSIDGRFGVAKPNSVPFYGIWDVDEFMVDGTIHPPLTTDAARWQKVVFDDRGYVSIQRMSGELIWATTKTDLPRKTITFDHSGKPHPDLRELFGTSWKAEFTFEDSSPEVLILTGRYDGRPATVKLRKNRTRYFLSPHERQWMRRTPRVIPYV